MSILEQQRSQDETLPVRIVNALRSVLGSESYMLHVPTLSGNEWAYTKDCLDSTFVSSVGAYVDKFETELCQVTGAKHAIAVVNGTAALHIALLMADVTPGDEVLVPSLTFIATANAIHYCGSIPHFIDCEETTMGVDPIALRDWLRHSTEMQNGSCINRATGRRIKALLPMHTFGHPCKIDLLQAIAYDFGLNLVEDAAESLGSSFRDKHTGTFGLLGTLSFNGNKTITTGGGGAILTNDSVLAKRAKHLTTTAKCPHPWEYNHDEVGFNYRMPNINAALGCAQLEQLPNILASKRRLFEKYRKAFETIAEVNIVFQPHNCESNYWLQTIKLNEAVSNERNSILEATNKIGIMTRPVWNLIHRLKPYRDCPRAPLPVAKMLEQTLLNIPSSAGIV